MPTKKTFSGSAVLLLAAVSAEATAGCAVPTDPTPADDRTEARPEEPVHPDVGCIRNGAIDTCPPAPRFVRASAFGNVATFEVGPFPAGDLIYIFVELVDEMNAGALSAAAVYSTWTCPTGEACPSWSSYATGEFAPNKIVNTEPGEEGAWTCGSSATLISYDVNARTWGPRTTVERVCLPFGYGL